VYHSREIWYDCIVTYYEIEVATYESDLTYSEIEVTTDQFEVEMV
jgi:hypothetical protein